MKSVLNFGDIEINQQNLITKVAGEIVELTQTEFRLILLLGREALDNPGGVLDRDDIIKFVWPLDHEMVWPRTLSTHMSNLRKKLNSQAVKIVSKRQTGFQLVLA